MGKSQNPLEGHVSGQSNKPLSQPAHSLKWKEVAEELKADVDDGLTGSEASSRLEEYGKNELGEGEGVNPGKILVRQGKKSEEAAQDLLAYADVDPSG